MTTKALSEPVPIHDFVAELKKFSEPAFEGIDQIIRFLENTPVLPDTLAPYLSWDKRHYTRNLIDKTPLYELVAICWEIGQSSTQPSRTELLDGSSHGTATGGKLPRSFAESGPRHLPARNRRHGGNESTPALRSRSAGTRPPCCQPPRVQPAGGKPARLFPPL